MDTLNVLQAPFLVRWEEIISTVYSGTTASSNATYEGLQWTICAYHAHMDLSRLQRTCISRPLQKFVLMSVDYIDLFIMLILNTACKINGSSSLGSVLLHNPSSISVLQNIFLLPCSRVLGGFDPLATIDRRTWLLTQFTQF